MSAARRLSGPAGPVEIRYVFDPTFVSASVRSCNVRSPCVPLLLAVHATYDWSHGPSAPTTPTPMSLDQYARGWLQAIRVQPRTTPWRRATNLRARSSGTQRAQGIRSATSGILEHMTWQMTRARVVGTLGLALVGVGAVVTLAGCTPEGAITEPVGQYDVGKSKNCPGEFLQSLANSRIESGLNVEVAETNETEQFKDVVSTAPICTASMESNRRLPSGQVEPIEYVALYEGELTEDITAHAQESGFEFTTETNLRRDARMVNFRIEPAMQLGIEGEGTYTVVHQIESEEIAALRG